MADKYGIPDGGDPYPGKIKYLGGNKRALTVREVYAVCKATWPQGKQELAAAVVMAESGGHPFVYNTYKSGHFGLFQISRAAWPDFFSGGSDQWADPEKNSAKAYEIYKEQGWNAWQGYSGGDWKKYKNQVADVATHYDGKPMKGLLDDIQTLGLGTVLGNAYDAVSSAAGTVADKASGGIGVLTDAYQALTTPAFWMRVAYGLTGVVLIVGGLMLIVRSSSAVKQATDTVTSVVPGGKAIKAVKGAKK